ncbi:Spore wall maturation protein DIT1 [Cyphellophora attinorum]|uniref:Spore wall maturation protein DIT1 n=1 Tax=Cyphellophora attinorum TaxID=1664694 RepID=A0A0N0NNT1_9EURO|nr:Spore wall maturation protein DIT1 [Phialophora attinorum]KPI41908.1 Spore wall maturation protein DIT1 [Phialophora attinorum]
MAASTFHEARIVYTTSTSGELNDIVSFHGLQSPEDFFEVCRACRSGPPFLDLRIDQFHLTATSRSLKGRQSSPAGLALVQYELHFTTHIAGLMMVVPADSLVDDAPQDRTLRMTFRDYMALVTLAQDTFRVPPRSLIQAPFAGSEYETRLWTDAVLAVFEECILFRGPENDKWHEGKAICRAKIQHYVHARSRIRFCLPAFPCKSYNLDKVADQWPDGAEYEALSTIYDFCREVKQVYPPGCVFEIISDGHVFSDCIGVDDEIVTEYNARLRKMADLLQYRSHEEGLDGCITFRNLHDILQPVRWVRNFFQETFVDLEALNHPVSTSRAIQDDINRTILLQACASNQDHIQQVIRQDPSHSITMLKSKSQRKKLAEKVAIEMMARNAAYSSLVELTMPHHVRLSIHAHNNAGPKFAVSLLTKHKFQPLTSFDGLKLSTRYSLYDERHHLHIPTPWHNCLVEVKDGHDTTYVCKAGLVKAELKESNVWSPRSGYVADHPRGGRFVLYRKRASRAESVLPRVIVSSEPQAVDVLRLPIPHL